MRILSLSAIVLILDQATKYLVKSLMTLRDSIPVIGETFKLTYIENDGMAFGIAIANKYVFNIFSVVAACAIFYFLIKMRDENSIPRIALAVIFGGAAGNLADRLIHGRVVDFFDVNIPDIPSFDLYILTTPPFDRWPIFNVADIAVSVGMMLLIYTIFTSSSPWFEMDAEPVQSENNP